MFDYKLDRTIKELVAAIRESDEYHRYQAAKTVVCKEEEKYRQVNEFRKQNFNMNIRQDESDLFQDIDNFTNNFRQLREDPEVQEFLAAELALCRMLQDICYQMVGAIDIDTSFL